MIVSVSTQAFDYDGSRVFALAPDAYLKSRAVSRRVSTQATLDGGTLVYDTGYSVSDREFALVSVTPSRDLADFFSRLVRYFDRIVVSLPDGCFEAVPLAMRMEGDRPAIEIRLIT
jgi:hypothetical protein